MIKTRENRVWHNCNQFRRTCLNAARRGRSPADNDLRVASTDPAQLLHAPTSGKCQDDIPNSQKKVLSSATREPIAVTDMKPEA